MPKPLHEQADELERSIADLERILLKPSKNEAQLRSRLEQQRASRRTASNLVR